jgi:hypothetical protein
MANDRIYIVCKSCRQDLSMFKYGPGGGGMGHPDKCKLLSEFIDEHIERCHPNGYGNTLGGDAGFFLIAESAEYKRVQNSEGDYMLLALGEHLDENDRVITLPASLAKPDAVIPPATRGRNS